MAGIRSDERQDRVWTRITWPGEKVEVEVGAGGGDGESEFGALKAEEG